MLLDQIMLDFLSDTANPAHDLHALGLGIWAYLKQRQARLMAEFEDPTYGRLQIYQLQADEPGR